MSISTKEKAAGPDSCRGEPERQKPKKWHVQCCIKTNVEAKKNRKGFFLFKVESLEIQLLMKPEHWQNPTRGPMGLSE